MRILFAVAMFLATFVASHAHAADPSGSWRIDREHFEGQMRGMVDAMLAEVPEGMRPQMEQMIGGMLEGVGARVAGVIIFESDGTAIFRRDDGTEETGRWVDRGDGVEIHPDQPGVSPLFGRIEGDEMRVEMEAPPDMPAELSMEQIWRRE